MGGIRRMTVSVAVDYKASTGADGKVTREPVPRPNSIPCAVC
jgi:flagellar M-ring protein FliF